ncbi:hypothetical protein OD350_28955 (plasmid) [Clostridium beijerinckii]|uniref:hypothetical protein n=1 Tax=Clostridium beijerinckii TaxID=1520 RepID=UPI0022279A7B|nr:hypothetical protein [Clostridium beijerinckii]UYZ39104.1 hypothetical protein OD350_28955 [Clostridium beijerinckii]
MDAKNMFIVMIIVIYALYLPTKIEQNSIDTAAALSQDYDEMLASATNDATQQLIYSTDSYSNELMAEGTKFDYRNINLNLDKALDRFYRTVYINLNIEENYSYQQAIKHRIPIKIAVGYDGFYVDYFKSDGTGEAWSDIHKFSDVQGDLVFHFTLSDEVTVTNSITKVTKTGTREELASLYPSSCLKDEETFKKVKSQVINTLIQSDLEYYTKNTNAIALRYGWNIKFNIPYWGNRAVNSVAFIAFYQGDGFAGGKKVFDSYGYATSQILNKRDVYGYTVDGKKLYSDNKLENVGKLTYFESPYEAAKDGYSPDPRYYIK